MTALTFDATMLAKLRTLYPQKIVAFDGEFGVICVSNDTEHAVADAQKEGFSQPYIFDTSLNKLLYLGYIPYSPFYDEPEWQNGYF